MDIAVRTTYPMLILPNRSIVPLRRLVHDLPFALLLQRRQFIRHHFVLPGFAQQFAIALPTVGREPPVGQRLRHRAARLAAVRAIANRQRSGRSAISSKVCADTLLPGPELQFAHAGRIDQRPALRQRDQFAMGRGMPSATVGLAHFRRAAAAPRPECGSRWSTCLRRTSRAAPPCARRRETPRARRARCVLASAARHDGDAVGHRRRFRRCGRRSSHRSALFRTITGAAPLSAASARYRSSRRRLKSPSSPQTRNTTSMFAAIGCSSSRFPAARREKSVRRGSTASTIACPPPASRAATQSPTTGMPARSGVRYQSAPEGSASRSPAAVMRRY